MMTGGETRVDLGAGSKSSSSGAGAVASASAGETQPLTTPLRAAPGTQLWPGCCSLWTFNARAAALHAAWFVVFVLLWALETRPDGIRRDVKYPLWVSYATFGDRPEPPLLALPGANAAAVRADLERVFPDFFQRPGIASPYPECTPPEGAKVGTMSVLPSWTDTGIVLSLHWLVVSFFALSFLFQAAAAVIDAVAAVRHRRHRRALMGDDQNTAARLVREDGADSAATPSVACWLRFVEYAFSASVMVVAIALQVGIMDAWTLFTLAALTWVTMILGLIGERVMAAEEALGLLAARCRCVSVSGSKPTRAPSPNDASGKPEDENESSASATATRVGTSLPAVRWTAHTAAWVTMGAVFVVLVAHFYQSRRACEFADAPGGEEENVAPDFVYAIVFCELALFVGFGLAQTAQFLAFDAWWRGESGEATARRGRRIEAAYVAQSLVSKTLLGWLVYGGNFASG